MEGVCSIGEVYIDEESPMTKQEYYEQHIPHRINLLITFRERYGESSNLRPDDIRDFYRCSKDISMMMVRFLLGEMGIKFDKQRNNPNDEVSEGWTSKLGIRQLRIDEVTDDTRHEHVKIVLKAANRALAHLEPDDVNHPIKEEIDNRILFDAINFTEEMVIAKMYKPNSLDYHRIMAMPNNDMHRKPILITS